jgi:tRNA pseudouridine32 synthase/23S rRNA pseudouridine746 synthase
VRIIGKGWTWLSVKQRFPDDRHSVGFSREQRKRIRLYSGRFNRVALSAGYCSLVITFSPAPAVAEYPTRFPSPFDRGALHPLARRAAMELVDMLQSPHANSWRLNEPGNGKMFGVLVVAAPDGTIGYLRGFSGMVNGQWEIEGWVPPAFERTMRDLAWIPGEAEMLDFSAQRATLLASLSETADTPEARRLTSAVRALDEARTARSRTLMGQIQDSYLFANSRGEVRSLRAIFAPAEPPAGAGDCAAPKLLTHAYRLALRPLALAEFWWGAPSSTGDRRAGVFYAACRGKCLPILTHMLGGLEADSAPLYGSAAIDAAEPVAVYEDEHLLVVNKPSGLLTVPGRSASLQDCVVTRLRARYPDATGPMVVHRLDLDTSGLLLVAKNLTIASALQRLFSLRLIDKQYVAWLDGDVTGDHGHITLPLRVDVDDRPRNIHDPMFGKPADTEWRVLAREHGRTRVQFTPHTGRTHQLRVHSAHPQGLDAPIVGDRLYGRTAPHDDERLLLHAERLAFEHPVSGATVVVEQPAPF